MDTAFALFKAEHEAFKAVVAGRLDDLERRVVSLERCDPETVIQQKLGCRLEALRRSLRDFLAPPEINKPPKITPGELGELLKKEAEKVAALNPADLPHLAAGEPSPRVAAAPAAAPAATPTPTPTPTPTRTPAPSLAAQPAVSFSHVPVSAAEADLRKMFSMSKVPAGDAPVIVKEFMATPTAHGTVVTAKLAEKPKAKAPAVDDVFFQTPTTPVPEAAPNPPASTVVTPAEPIADPVKRSRGRPRKSPAPAPAPAAAPLFEAIPEAAPAPAPASPPVFASVPARVDDAISVSSGRVAEGTRQVFKDILESCADGDLAKTWERAFNKPLAAMDRPKVVAELLSVFVDPDRNFTLEDPQAIGSDPNLRLNPGIEGLDD